ncbi:MAG: hypothetical protein ACXIT9_08980 [Nitritalea sp.]
MSDIDIPQLINLKMEINGNRIVFNNLDPGYYYLVSTTCEFCLDSELSKIEEYNKNNEKKIHLIISDETTINRITQFMDVTKVYRSSHDLSDFSFMIDKRNSKEFALIGFDDIIK